MSLYPCGHSGGKVSLMEILQNCMTPLVGIPMAMPKTKTHENSGIIPLGFSHALQLQYPWKFHTCPYYPFLGFFWNTP